MGIGVLYLWFMVGGLRSPSNRVPLWVIHAKRVADPCGDMWSWAVSLGVSWGVDVFHCVRKMICESSGD